MTTISTLDAAARAWAIVCLSDGRLVPLEERRFLSFAAAEPAFSDMAPADAAAAWLRAYNAVSGGPDYSKALPDIANAVAGSVAAPAAIMRAAQAALIADRFEAPQETGAIQAIAAALGLDPAGY